jgi:YbgC/YbaW family acyl-CoA thioester hydrolase
LESKIQLRVQHGEIDELGHVNNARFLEYLERGRMDWYHRCDPTLNNIAVHGFGTVVVKIDINYRRECFVGTQLSVVTKPYSRGRTSYVLHQKIYDIDNQCVSDALVTSVVMDMRTRDTARLPESLAMQFAQKSNREIS